MAPLIVASILPILDYSRARQTERRTRQAIPSPGDGPNIARKTATTNHPDLRGRSGEVLGGIE